MADLRTTRKRFGPGGIAPAPAPPDPATAEPGRAHVVVAVRKGGRIDLTLPWAQGSTLVAGLQPDEAAQVVRALMRVLHDMAEAVNPAAGRQRCATCDGTGKVRRCGAGHINATAADNPEMRPGTADRNPGKCPARGSPKIGTLWCGFEVATVTCPACGGCPDRGY